MLTLANTGLTAVLAVLLALTQQLTLVTVLVVLGIGTSLITFTFGAVLLPRGWTLRPLAFEPIKEEGLQQLRTGGWLWLAAILAMLAGNLDVLVLNHFGDLASVGAYALAVSLASKAQIVNHSLYTVLLPNAARLRTIEDVRGFVMSGLVRSGVIGLALLALLPLAEPFILIVYGIEYVAAIDLFRLLLGVVIFDVLATPLLLLALAYRRPQLMAASDAVRALTVGGVAIGLVPSYGATGAITARLLARVAGAALVLLALRAKL
jgi:O-antigen/teichoic acid export membrane protein